MLLVLLFVLLLVMGLPIAYVLAAVAIVTCDGNVYSAGDSDYRFALESPTNQQFPILPDDVLDKLREKYSFAYQARVDETHSAVRFCTCWATKEENVEALLADIRAII